MLEPFDGILLHPLLSTTSLHIWLHGDGVLVVQPVLYIHSKGRLPIPFAKVWAPKQVAALAGTAPQCWSQRERSATRRSGFDGRDESPKRVKPRHPSSH